MDLTTLGYDEAAAGQFPEFKRTELAAGDAETQGFEAQLAIIEHQVGVEISEGQIGAVDDAFAGELHIGVHHHVLRASQLLY